MIICKNLLLYINIPLLRRNFDSIFHNLTVKKSTVTESLLQILQGKNIIQLIGCIH